LVVHCRQPTNGHLGATTHACFYCKLALSARGACALLLLLLLLLLLCELWSLPWGTLAVQWVQRRVREGSDVSITIFGVMLRVVGILVVLCAVLLLREPRRGGLYTTRFGGGVRGRGWRGGCATQMEGQGHHNLAIGDD